MLVKLIFPSLSVLNDWCGRTGHTGNYSFLYVVASSIYDEASTGRLLCSAVKYVSPQATYILSIIELFRWYSAAYCANSDG